MHQVIVTENPKQWQLEINGLQWMTPAEYLAPSGHNLSKNTKILNLCRSFQYQSQGYYVSLLAEARGHKILPSVATIQDFRFPSIMRGEAEGFDDAIQKVLGQQLGDKVEFNIYFGLSSDTPLDKIGVLLFNLFQTPLLRASFSKRDKWVMTSLKTISMADVPAEDREILKNALVSHLSGKNVIRKGYDRKKYDLAILVNPKEATPPSDPKAISKFVKAAEKVGFNVDLITKNDFGKLMQYDALFIRETTNVNHHTFRFAKKAQAEGLIVIDDPDSILRCTNKVYLSELLSSHKISTPKSAIIRKDQRSKGVEGLEFPMIIKEPDGSFSKGVKKVSNQEELEAVLADFFQKSELVIAQEFLPTDFDWRVGLIDGQPIYLCKYYMAPQHWQIVNWSKKGSNSRLGKSDSIPLTEAPKGLIETAVKAAALIGNGLYGVDVKERNGKYYIIEVNDNPSIDEGIEDKIAKSGLYTSIMQSIMNRLEA